MKNGTIEIGLFVLKHGGPRGVPRENRYVTLHNKCALTNLLSYQKLLHLHIFLPPTCTKSIMSFSSGQSQSLSE